jgi:hypothetical protein
MNIKYSKGAKGLAKIGIPVIAAIFLLQGMAYAIGGIMSGSGTIADPYLVEDYADLKAVGTTYGLGAVYRLTAEIDASASASENSGEGFAPIGNGDTPFTGKFHGGGHIIKHLYINRPATDYIGLFGYIYESTIDSLGLVDNMVSGSYFVGGIIGKNELSCTISSCFNTGNVSGLSHVGGIAGEITSATTISNCYNSGSISASSEVAGGIVGRVEHDSILCCYNTGSISATIGVAGGIAGYSDNSVVIGNCYNTGSISGSNNLGGIVGYNGPFVSVSNCYNAGGISGETSTGGIAGLLRGGAISYCYWDTQNSGQSGACGTIEGGTVTSVTGLTTAEMKDPSNLINLDLVTIWTIRPDSTYPGLKVLDNAPFSFGESLSTDRTFVLSRLLANDFDIETAGSGLAVRLISTSAGITDSVGSLTLPGGVANGSIITVKYRVGGIRTSDTLLGNIATSYITLVTLSGSGTEGDPYLIANYTDLKTVGINSTYNFDAVYRVIADIDASPSATENAGEGFIPIGTNVTPFTGVFHGSGHVISKLTINRPATDNVGLFGYANDCSIDSLGLVDNAIAGQNSVGGITGYIEQNGAISHCRNTGSVSGTGTVGGIAGNMFFAAVSHCHNTGSIFGPTLVGGIAGINHYSDINRCFNTGAINASVGMAGGIAGYSYAPGTIGNCYNTGRVVASNTVGGVVGHNGAFSTISKCYNSGGLSGTVLVGGVAGYQEFNGTIADSYWDTQVSGQSIACGDNSEGGTITAVVGLATDAMKDPASLTNLDFAGNWAMRTDSTYPGLQAMDNAPFAFRDSLISGKDVDLSQLLLNDCDLETAKANLLLHVANLSAGTTDSISALSFPDTAVGGAIITVNYRVAENMGSDTLWGNIATALIQYDDQPPSAVNLIAPANQYLSGDSQVNFIWNSATDDHGLGYYQFQTALDSSFTVYLRDTVINDTTLLLLLSSTDTINYWRIRAVDACGNQGGYSAVWQFEIDVTNPDVPTLSAPADNYWTEDSTIVCSWGEVAKKAKASQVSYVIQLDTTNTFMAPMFVDTTAILSDTFNLSEGQYYWRVMAFDLAGNFGTYSSYRTFGIDTTAPLFQSVKALPDDPSSPYGPYEVTSSIYDLSGVKTAYLFIQINGGSWDSTAMFFAADSLRDSIPEINPATDETLSVSYYIKAVDLLDHQSISSTYGFKAIGPLGVAGKPELSLPRVYALENAYPNPSRGQTTFKYQLPKDSKVSLTVYNVVGQEIKRFDLGSKPAGYHQVNWSDNLLPNGVYIYQLKAGEYSATRKLLIVR